VVTHFLCGHAAAGLLVARGDEPRSKSLGPFSGRIDRILMRRSISVSNSPSVRPTTPIRPEACKPCRQTEEIHHIRAHLRLITSRATRSMIATMWSESDENIVREMMLRVTPIIALATSILAPVPRLLQAANNSCAAPVMIEV
jgi:hypothetical protein